MIFSGSAQLVRWRRRRSAPHAVYPTVTTGSCKPSTRRKRAPSSFGVTSTEAGVDLHEARRCLLRNGGHLRNLVAGNDNIAVLWDGDRAKSGWTGGAQDRVFFVNRPPPDPVPFRQTNRDPGRRPGSGCSSCERRLASSACPCGRRYNPNGMYSSWCRAFPKPAQLWHGGERQCRGAAREPGLRRHSGAETFGLSSKRVLKRDFSPKDAWPTVACASRLTEMVQGREVKDALSISHESLCQSLDGLPRESHHAAQLCLTPCAPLWARVPILAARRYILRKDSAAPPGLGPFFCRLPRVPPRCAPASTRGYRLSRLTALSI